MAKQLPKTGPAGTHHFRVLMFCMLISIALLVLTRAAIEGAKLDAPQWAPIVSSICPLIAYHLFYLAPRAKHGLTPAAIDSVYYFGFLITILALGISALSMVSTSIDEKQVEIPDPGAIIAQFGVGLLATGYAIVARLHLSSHVRELGDVNPDDLIDRYLTRSRLLIERLDVTLHSFDELQNKCREAVADIEQLGKHILKSSAETFKGFSETFQSEIRLVFDDAKGAIKETRDVIVDPTFANERKSFNRHMKAIADAAERTRHSMGELADGNEKTANSFSIAAGAADRVSESLSSIPAREHDAAQAFFSFVSSLQEAQASLQRSTTQLADQIAKSNSAIAENVRISQQSTRQLTEQIESSAAAIAENVRISSEAATLLTEHLIQIARIVIERTNDGGAR